MALTAGKIAFKTGMIQLMTDMRTRTENADNEYANRLGDLIEAFIKSADGIYVAGSLQAGTYVVTPNLPAAITLQ